MVAFVKTKPALRLDDQIYFSLWIGTRPVPDWENVLSVQADGDELYFAESVVGRTTPLRVFTFVGEEAKMIVANWR